MPRLVHLKLSFLLLMLPLVGCVSSFEHVADHLAFKSLEHEHDLTIFEGDLAAFRGCLQHYGGTCTDPSAAHLLPAAPQGGKPAQAKLSPSGQSSVSSLPANNPARLAHDALANPTLQQAVDLHNQLRGHGSGSLPSQPSDGKPGSCSKIELAVSTQQAVILHDKALRATAAGGWAALQHHTGKVLAQSQPGDPGHEEKVADHHKASSLTESSRV